MRVLIIEDEPKVAAFLKRGLEEQNFQVEMAYDGQAGLGLAMDQHFDIVLLDVIVPFISGTEVCKRIKEQKPQVPILMLTALGTTEDKILGFDAGADDYLVKPFEFRELLARIKALTKRTQTLHNTARLRCADLTLDLEKKVAYRGMQKIELTAKEFALLEYFLRNTNKVVSRVDIAEKVWDIGFDTGTNIVDVYVNILRKKIDKGFDGKLIHTRVGMGYYFGPQS